MAEPLTLAQAYAWAKRRLDVADARALLCCAARCAPTTLIAFGERPLDMPQLEAFRALVERRVRGEPVAYLTGQREFFARSFSVGEGVLIPRPETELVVEAALDWARGRERLRVLDLGTGSGILAITLALELGGCAERVVGVDASPAALAQARRNASTLGAAVDLVESDWFAALGGEDFDLIVANPPYIADDDPHLAQGDLRFEPRSALAAGADGLADLRRIVAAAPARLRPGGALVLEHGYDQGAPVRALLAAAELRQVHSLRDLAGHERVSCAERRPTA